MDTPRLDTCGVKIGMMPAPPFHAMGDVACDLVGELPYVEEIGTSGAAGYYIVVEYDTLAEATEESLDARKTEIADILARFSEDEPEQDEVPCVFELDENGEANGTVHPFFDNRTRAEWFKDVWRPERGEVNIAFGLSKRSDLCDGTVCDHTLEPLN